MNLKLAKMLTYRGNHAVILLVRATTAPEGNNHYDAAHYD